ncbi:MAG TPA: hypothetical protein VNP03_16950 [Pseudonocardia sp.]|nr:hypothetical protein [Pseudonocardia sp.]
MAAVVRPLVVATVLLLGAGPVAVTGASDPAGGPRLSVAVDVAASASVRDLPEGMLRDQRTVVAAVDGYWKRHFAEHFGKRYHSPLVVGGYLGGRGPSCDGRRAAGRLPGRRHAGRRAAGPDSGRRAR